MSSKGCFYTIYNTKLLMYILFLKVGEDFIPCRDDGPFSSGFVEDVCKTSFYQCFFCAHEIIFMNARCIKMHKMHEMHKNA